MSIRNEKLKVGALALAVQGALAAMIALPARAEDDAAALKNPTNTLEIGVENVAKDSAKFGEYTGLNKKGVEAVVNFSVRGGDGYGGGEGTRRWSVTGTDLGLTSRSAGATVGNQGRWNIGAGYDELRHNLWDTYQTPYQGAMGGNNFTLPAGFGVVTTGGTSVGTRVLTTTQQAALHTVDVGTTRKNTSLNAGVTLAGGWNLTFDYNHLDQTGAKLMGFGSTGGGTGLAAVLPGISAEAVAILPNPTDYKTDTFNLALNWAGEKGHMTAAYFGSYFRDGYDRVTFQTFAATGTSTNSVIQTMSTPPGNNFHQLNLSGGYQVAAKTKLTGGLSYARNTQNDAFVYDSYMMLTPPGNSLDGLVVNTHADLKLTNQASRDLMLSAAVKYDERDNRTASNLYNFNALSGNTAHYAHYPNTPLSNRKTQLEMAGDYRLGKGQNLRLAYNRENVKRWCNQYAIGGTTALVDAYVAGLNNYPAGTNCVVATASKDDRLSAAYRIKTTSGTNFNAGYTYSDRKTDSDPNAIAAFISLNGNPDVPTATIRGMNAGDFRGFYPYFNASRKQQMLKAGATWQAGEALSLGLGGRYTDDKYDSLYGVRKGNSWSLNLDATYNYSDNGSLAAYVTRQHMQRDLTDQQKSPTVLPTATNGATATALSVPPGATWTNRLDTDDTTVGIGFKHAGLMGSRLDLTGDLTYSQAKSGYGTQLNYAGATTGGLTCSAPSILSCGQLPDIRNTLTQFRLTGTYRVDKRSRIVLGYLFQKLKAEDWLYNGYQYGYTPATLMPTNQQVASYTVNVVTASYVMSFR